MSLFVNRLIHPAPGVFFSFQGCRRFLSVLVYDVTNPLAVSRGRSR